MSNATELLVNFSADELDALADSKLSPSAQTRLDELLRRNADNLLRSNEKAELDQLLNHVDQLTTLKTRAKYTLQQQAGA